MKKINKIVSVLLLIALFIGCGMSSVALPKSGKVVAMKLTAEEMECIVGGVGGDKDKSNPEIEKPGFDDSDNDEEEERKELVDYLSVGNASKNELIKIRTGLKVANPSYDRYDTDSYSYTFTEERYYKVEGRTWFEGLKFKLGREFKKTVSDTTEIPINCPPRHISIPRLEEWVNIYENWGYRIIYYADSYEEKERLPTSGRILEKGPTIIGVDYEPMD